MKKSIWLAAGAAIALAVPAVAMMHGGMGMGASEPQKRADVEARVKEHFAKLDANKDGFVEQAEVAATHEKMKAEKLDAHFAAMDANKDGSISRAEFDAGHAAREGGEHGMRGHHGKGDARMGPGRMHRMGGGHMMTMADADKDGKVSLAEALKRPLERFDAADANKDGTLTPEERKAAREKMREEWRAKKAG